MKLNPATGCGCCQGCPCSGGGGYCVRFCITNCTAPTVGATVTVKDGGGATVASGTTDSTGCVTLDIGASGTYTVTVTIGGYVVYTTTAPIASCTVNYSLCGVTICAVTTAAAAIAGATVTVKSGGTTVASGTADLTGCVKLVVPAAGNYEVIVAATGYVTSDKPSVALACCGTKTITLCPANQCIPFRVSGCTGPLAGATVTAADETATTDANGHACIPLPAAGTYSYSISASRFATYTGSFTVTGTCGVTSTIIVTLSPATGYACCTCCNYPLPLTLFLTDSKLGAVTLTYDPAQHFWVGSQPSSHGLCSCGPPLIESATTAWYAFGTLSYTGTLDCLSLLSCPRVPNAGNLCPFECNQASISKTDGVNASSLSCPPFSASYSMPGNCPGTGPLFYSDTAMAIITISE